MKKIIVPGVLGAMLIILQACDRPGPEEIQAKLHLPSQDFVGNVVVGQQLYAANCARCHGPQALGSDQGPPLVHKTYRPGHHGDLVFHLAVKKGVKRHHWRFGDMPPVERLSPEDVGHIISYLRSEQKKAGIS